VHHREGDIYTAGIIGIIGEKFQKDTPGNTPATIAVGGITYIDRALRPNKPTWVATAAVIERSTVLGK